MYRTKTCGELRLTNVGENVTLSGWVQRTRKMGGMTFVDLRDRYGITQLVFDESKDATLCEHANKMGREWVIQIIGKVNERESKNKNLPTGDIEIIVEKLNILNESKLPPFTIEENTDGGDDLRMKYRYLDLRRPNVRQNLGGSTLSRLERFSGNRNTHADRFNSRRRTRLCGTFAYESRAILCLTPKPTDLKAVTDGSWHGSLFPNSKMFP